MCESLSHFLQIVLKVKFVSLSCALAFCITDHTWTPNGGHVSGHSHRQTGFSQGLTSQASTGTFTRRLAVKEEECVNACSRSLLSDPV